MNLIIDSGNTLTKLALYQGVELVAFKIFPGTSFQEIESFCKSEGLIKNAILSSVNENTTEISRFLSENYQTIILDSTTRVPIKNRYSTPETLGKDRLAAAVGANQMFTGSNILVIDAGTAITYDLVTAAGEYMGGGISPGINMRYNALHTFTGRLPQLNATDDEAKLIGDDTTSSIHSGVLNGVLAEIDGIIKRYEEAYSGIKIILTGGDHNYFDKRLKIKTFAAPKLVLEGLNLILRFNIETK